MRWSFALLLFIAVLLSGATLGGSARVASPAPAAPSASGFWLALSATNGLRVSHDGRRWARPRGVPARGTFYAVAPDVTHPGVAYATNGDVFVTGDWGAQWSRLGGMPATVGPAGATTLAVSPRDGTLYAAGTRVLAYRPSTRQWRSLDAPRSSGVPVTALLAGRDGVFYARADGRVYRSGGNTGPWKQIAAPGLVGAAITALAFGPDGATPYLAARNRAIWYIAHGAAVRQPGGDFPAGATVYGLFSDPAGADLYAATSQGLYAQDQNLSRVNAPGKDWRQVTPAHGDPVVTLLPARQGMLALTAGGAIYQGRRARWQALSWRGPEQSLAAAGSSFTAALTAANWNSPPQAVPLPAPFTARCLPVGPASGEKIDVCGPFLQFYLPYGPRVLGWPRQPARRLAHGVIEQAFDHMVMDWTPRKQVYLKPVGQIAAGERHFPRPTPQQVRANGAATVYINGYYVEPVFYQFWRFYQYHGVSIFGPPISQGLKEPSTDGSGAMVQVQYFVNARLEYHDDGSASSPIRVSSLGQQ